MGLTAGARLGPYEIESIAGNGGMGEVYRARDSRLGRVVAVKILPTEVAGDPVRLARFELEARTTASLAHPHICTIHDTGQDGSYSYSVSEFVDGETLQHRLVRGVPALDDALEIAEEILDALDYAHRRGVLHRDIKPSNIMLSPTGVKLLDFGLAKSNASSMLATTGRPDTVSLTAEGSFVGTVQYAAPEQLEGKAFDTRTDLFAFGAVLYELLTGTRAFLGETAATVISAIMTRDPVPIGDIRSEIPPSLDRFVTRLLAKDPDDRWQTARDALSELRWIRTAAPGASARPRGPRAPAFWIAVASVAGVIGIVGAALHGIPEPDRSAVRPVPITFEVSVSPGTSLFGSMTAASISPDGRFLAFLAASPGEPQQLWIHDFASRKAHRIEGTRGALAPFWSPDGRAVGFELDETLQKIDLTGGSPQTILKPGHAKFGASWNRDGAILFNGGLLSGLVLAPVESSSAVPVTRLDPTRAELQHNWPQFLPDGRHFLFLSINARPPATQLWVGSLDSRPDQRVHLLDDVSSAQYVAPGYLLFGREGLLYAQRFEPSTGVLSGSPVLVTESVSFNKENGRSDFSASAAGVLVYRSPPAASIGVLERSGRRVADIGEPGQYAEPTVSPDGSKVAAVRLNASGGRDVWVFDLASRLGTALASDPDWKVSPIWTPDGQQLLFMSIHEGAYKVLLASLDQSAKEMTIEHLFWLADWSRDGRFIAYQRLGRSGQNDAPQLTLFSVHGDSPPWQSLPHARTAYQAKFSPDGHWIAYDARDSGQWEVYVSRFPSGEGKWQVSRNGGVEPRWRGDSKELFYVSRDGSLMSVQMGGRVPPSAPATVCTLPFSGNRGPLPERAPYDVTPDGQRIVTIEGARSSNAWPLTVLVNWTTKIPQQ